MDDRLLIFVAVFAAIVIVIVLSVFFSKRGHLRKPERSELYRNVSEALVEGDVTRALQLLRQIALEHSDDWNSQLLLGDLLRGTGRAKKALHLHQMLATRSPGDKESKVRILESVARDALALAIEEKALASAREMLELDRHNAAAAEITWQAQDSLGDWDAAWEALQRFYKKTKTHREGIPTQAGYKAFLGQKSLQAGDLREAQQHLRAALRLDPELHQAKVFLGDANSQAGKVEDAIGLWKEYAKQCAGDADIVFGRLEKTLFSLGRFGELNKIYEDILGEEAEHPGALAALARMSIKRGLSDEAEQYLQILYEKFPEDRRGRRLLMRSLLTSGKTDEALRYIESWLDESHSVQAHCSSCGYQDSDLLLRCPHCDAWQDAAFAPPIR